MVDLKEVTKKSKQAEIAATDVNAIFQAIFRLSSGSLAKAKKGKALKYINDQCVVGMQLFSQGQVDNSVDVAAAMLVAEKAISILSNHAPKEVIEQFDKEYTKKLASGDLQRDIISNFQRESKAKADES